MELFRDKEIITTKYEASRKEGDSDFVLAYQWYAHMYQYVPLIQRDEHEEKTRFDDNFSLFVVMKYFFDEDELHKHLKLTQTTKNLKCLKFFKTMKNVQKKKKRKKKVFDTIIASKIINGDEKKQKTFILLLIFLKQWLATTNSIIAIGILVSILLVLLCYHADLIIKKRKSLLIRTTFTKSNKICKRRLHCLFIMVMFTCLTKDVYSQTSYCQWKAATGECEQCLHNRYLHNGTCVEKCPTDYVERRPNWVLYWKREIGGRCVYKGNFVVVKAWGQNDYGGSDPSLSSGVLTIFSNRYAFAALKSDGSVKAWGDSNKGGSDPSLTSGVNYKL
jgi:hypothetical protein